MCNDGVNTEEHGVEQTDLYKLIFLCIWFISLSRKMLTWLLDLNTGSLVGYILNEKG